MHRATRVRSDLLSYHAAYRIALMVADVLMDRIWALCAFSGRAGADGVRRRGRRGLGRAWGCVRRVAPPLSLPPGDRASCRVFRRLRNSQECTNVALPSSSSTCPPRRRRGTLSCSATRPASAPAFLVAVCATSAGARPLHPQHCEIAVAPRHWLDVMVGFDLSSAAADGVAQSPQCRS